MKGVEKVHATPNELVLVSLKEGGYQHYFFYCIPDSIDPREKTD